MEVLRGHEENRTDELTVRFFGCLDRLYDEGDVGLLATHYCPSHRHQGPALPFHRVNSRKLKISRIGRLMDNDAVQCGQSLRVKDESLGDDDGQVGRTLGFSVDRDSVGNEVRGMMEQSRITQTCCTHGPHLHRHARASSATAPPSHLFSPRPSPSLPLPSSPPSLTLLLPLPHPALLMETALQVSWAPSLVRTGTVPVSSFLPCTAGHVSHEKNTWRLLHPIEGHAKIDPYFQRPLS